MLVIEIAGASEDTDESRAEVLPGLPAHRELLLKAGEGLGHVGAEGVHVGHCKRTKALEPDHLAFLFMPERIGREFIHLEGEGVRRDMHVPHDREHAEAGSKPEHHLPVPGMNPYLAFPELIGVFKDRPVSEVVHHRGLDRRAAVWQHDLEDVIGQQIPY